MQPGGPRCLSWEFSSSTGGPVRRRRIFRPVEPDVPVGAVAETADEKVYECPELGGQLLPVREDHVDAELIHAPVVKQYLEPAGPQLAPDIEAGLDGETDADRSIT